jgi:hypothetical protein
LAHQNDSDVKEKADILKLAQGHSLEFVKSMTIKYKFIIFFCFVFYSYYSSAWGAPATNLQLSHDLQKINIEADHPSDRLDRNFIQKVVVIRNSKDKQYFYFSHQTRADKFVTALDYVTNPGDHLDIELYSSEGGITKGSMDLP